MNRAILLTAAAAAALSLAACNKPATTPAPPADAAAQAATDATGAAQDAVGAAVGQTSAATLGANTKQGYVMNAGIGDMYEIQAGNIAATRAKNADVKAFGKSMVVQHTAMSNEMKPLITAAGQTPADKLDERRQGFIDNLKTASAADFDNTYIEQQVAAHGEALTLMQGYADAGGDAGLKAGAAKAVPKVQMHLDKAKSIQATLK
jgi:putative membrane protein